MKTTLSLLIALALAACSSPPGPGGTGGGGGDATGGGSGAGGGGGAAVTADQACTDAAAAICAKQNTCVPAFVKQTWGDVPTCQAREKVSCLSWFGQGGTLPAGSGLTPDKLETCLAALNGQSCADLRNAVRLPDCTIAGTLANGSACGTDSQCQSANCKVPNGATCGVCAARVAAGQNCATINDCQDGLTCGGGQCKTPGVAGTTCSPTQPCLPTLYCNNNTCAQPQTDAGAACTGGFNGCDLAFGVYCNNNVCTNVGFAAAGSPCGFAGGVYTTCTHASCRNNICAALAADGASCQNASCADPAICTGTGSNAVCKLPNPGACI